MSNDNTALALALGAGAGLGLWYVLRDEKEAKAPATPTTSAPASTTPPTATPPTAPCSLRLDAQGLTSDGATIDIAAAVAKCQAAGRADLVIADDAPSAASSDLATALGTAGILINQRRNGRRNARRPGRRAPRAPYTREGRTILRDGAPVLHLERVDRGDQHYAITPHEADQLAQRVVDLLNGRGRRQASGVDLPRFAATVRTIADGIDEDPTPDGLARGRFARKVFIAAIRRALVRTEYAGLSRAAIDRALVDANREGLLELSRADLVAVMDPAEVRDSEIQHMMSIWHFVVAERPDARNAGTHRVFLFRTLPKNGNSRTRWYEANPPTTWEDAKRRIVAAGLLDERILLPTEWQLVTDLPPQIRVPADRLRPLP